MLTSLSISQNLSMQNRADNTCIPAQAQGSCVKVPVLAGPFRPGGHLLPGRLPDGRARCAADRGHAGARAQVVLLLLMLLGAVRTLKPKPEELAAAIQCPEADAEPSQEEL